MKKTSVRRAVLSCALLASTATVALAASSATAQTAAPLFRSIDSNGVDLVQGDYVMNFEEGSIGSGKGRLPIIRQNVGNAFTQWDGYTFRRTVTGATTTIEVGREGRFIERFVNGVPTKANGASITTSPGGYTYTMADGTAISFTDLGSSDLGVTNICGSPNAASSCELVPESISTPDGVTLALAWATRTYTPTGQSGLRLAWRLSRVSNNFGYRVQFTYALNTPWDQRSGAKFYNDNVSMSIPQGSVAYTPLTGGGVQVTDMNNKVWEITSTSIKRPGEATPGFWLEGTADAVTAVNRDGVRTRYTRTVLNNIATMVVKDALDHETTITSNLATGRPSTVKNARNETTTYTYDGYGRLTDIRQPEGNAVHYTLDARGNIKDTQFTQKTTGGTISIFTHAGYDVTCSNPKTCNKPNWTQDPIGNQTEYVWDPTHGGIKTLRLPAAKAGDPRPEIRYSYTTFTNALSGIGTPQLTGISQCQTMAAGVSTPCQARPDGTNDELQQGFNYDTSGNLVSTSTASGDNSLSATTTFEYDAVGNLQSRDGPLTGDIDKIRYRYDPARRLVGIIAPDFDETNDLKNRATRTSYNDAGLVTSVEQGTVSSSDTDWSTFVPLQAVGTAYDSFSRPLTRTLTAGGTTFQLTQFHYDAVGRVDCVAQRMNPAHFSTIVASTNACTQDAAPSLEFGADRIVATGYDEVGRVNSIISAVGTADESNELTATFTPNGRIWTVMDAENNKTTFEYDGFDRLKKMKYPVASPKGTGASSETDYEEVLQYDTNSRPKLVRNRAGEQTGFEYDNLGRVHIKDLPLAEPDVTFEYDLMNRMTSATQSGGSSYSFRYDSLGRMAEELQPLGGSKSVKSEYNLADQRTKITWPDGFFVNQSYFGTGEMKKVTENGSFDLASYEYDDLGRRIRLVDGNGVVTSYSYKDANNQSGPYLRSLTHDLSGSDYDVTLGFSYNPAGQIVQNTRSNDKYATTAFSSISTPVDGLNRISKDGVTYDARGNMTSDGSATYSYTSENMMTSAGSVTMERDPLKRLSKVVSGASTSRYLYDGARVIGAYDSSGTTLTTRYTFGAGGDESLTTHWGSARYWNHSDERGSLLTASKSDATPSNPATGYARYEEYGSQQTAGAGLFQFTGQKAIPGTALLDYKARVYNPALGRFMQPDPSGYADGMNTYAYVQGDPINRVDPSGLNGCGASNDAEAVVCGGMIGGGSFAFALLRLLQVVASGDIQTGVCPGGYTKATKVGNIVVFQGLINVQDAEFQNASNSTPKATGGALPMEGLADIIADAISGVWTGQAGKYNVATSVTNSPSGMPTYVLPPGTNGYVPGDGTVIMSFSFYKDVPAYTLTLAAHEWGHGALGLFPNPNDPLRHNPDPLSIMHGNGGDVPFNNKGPTEADIDAALKNCGIAAN